MRPAIPAPVRTERWEVGSAFPLPPPPGPGQPRTGWLPRDVVLHGTGRQAIHALLQHGRDVHDWQRVLIPSYSAPTSAVPCETYFPSHVIPAPPTPGPLRRSPGQTRLYWSHRSSESSLGIQAHYPVPTSFSTSLTIPLRPGSTMSTRATSWPRSARPCLFPTALQHGLPGASAFPGILPPSRGISKLWRQESGPCISSRNI